MVFNIGRHGPRVKIIGDSKYIDPDTFIVETLPTAGCIGKIIRSEKLHEKEYYVVEYQDKNLIFIHDLESPSSMDVNSQLVLV